MARCGCSGNTCSCVLRGTGATSVTGAGTVGQPYVINTQLYLAGGADGNIALTVSGVGSPQDPYVINAAQELYLDDLRDVNAAGGSTGHVLAKQADGTFALVPASTAPVGAINKDTTLKGDGSAGNPLGVLLAAGGGLSSTPTGLAVAAQGTFQNYTPVINSSNGSTVAVDSGSLLRARYKEVGDLVFVRIMLRASLVIPVASGFYTFSLPVPARGSGLDDSQILQAQLTVGSATTDVLDGVATIEGGNTIARTRIVDRYGTPKTIGSGYPAWGSFAHRLIIQGWYEKA